MKNVLIIGGTYFTGRVFAMVANKKGYKLTFINRGTYSMSYMENTSEYKCDRHNAEGLKAIPAAKYDAVVDFCAYTPGDCRTLLENLNAETEKYILITTADVYDMTTREPKSERSELQHKPLPGPASEYMFNKRLLEDEARAVCNEKGIKAITIRPAFIYGPYNYAPRESYYIEKICRHSELPVPYDADAKWNFVYVKDVAEAICACVEKDIENGKAYNLSNDEETISYTNFIKTLQDVSDIPFETANVTVEDVLKYEIPVPFPLYEEENELFLGRRASMELGIKYTPLSEGLKKTYNAFKSVYTQE